MGKIRDTPAREVTSLGHLMGFPLSPAAPELELTLVVGSPGVVLAHGLGKVLFDCAA